MEKDEKKETAASNLETNGLEESKQDGNEETKGDVEDEENEAEIPEEMPEDAIFIPLGFTRQRPPTFYRGSDPEWQSFLEFRKDHDKEKAVRSISSLLFLW